MDLDIPLAPSSLETALRDLAPRLTRYCVGRAADAALGEEAAQEALVALVARWRAHGPPDSPEAFVFTIARRRLGRALWKRRLLAPLETLFGASEASAVPGPHERAEGRDALRRTLDALAELPPREHEALLLAAGGELSTRAAAEVLGVSLSAFKMRVHRARRHLETLLQRPDLSESDHG